MKFFGVAIVLFGILIPALAVDPEDAINTPWRSNFYTGERELTVGGTAYFSPSGALSGRPTINYSGISAQFGYMLTDMNADDDSWSGNLEGIIEGYGASIYKGRGTYMAGTTLWLRYNIVPPSWRLVPYLQAGAGMTVTDVDDRVLGQDFNFNLNLAAGVRFFVNSRCSINLEGRYQHISNAGMSERNLGIDAQAAVLSASWFF